MTIKDVISNHPHFESTVRCARAFLDNPGMLHAAGYDGTPVEDVLVRELLHICDNSPSPEASSFSTSVYLDGQYDRDGVNVNRGQIGLIQYLMQLAKGNTAESYVAQHGMGQLNNLCTMFNNWPPRNHLSGGALALFNSAAHLITRTANSAGIVLTPAQVAHYANRVRIAGATTDEEFIAAFDTIMRQGRQYSYMMTGSTVEFNRVCQEVSRLLEVACMYRMPFQIEAYAAEIMFKYGPNLSEHDVSTVLDAILLREMQGNRGTLGIEPFPTLTHEESIVAKSLRANLAKQGESWTMKEIDEAAIAIVKEVKEAGIPLTDEMVSDYIAHQTVSRAAQKARSTTAASKETSEDKTIRNITSLSSGVKSSLKIAAEEMLANCRPVQPVKVIAYNNGDSYSFYRNDVLHVMAREYGVSPIGNPLLGSWVLRKLYTGEYVDHDFNRHDLAERQAIKIGE